MSTTTHPRTGVDDRAHVVLGAGPAGRTVASVLADAGRDVRVVDRSTTTEDLEAAGVAGVESTLADLSDPQQATDATAGADVLYHCVNVGYHLQVEVMPRIAEAILTAARANDARLVVLDTLYPYGRADGEHLTESTPWAAMSRKGRMRADLDRRYLAAHADGEVSVALGRSADFFGPGVLESSLGATFFPRALAGEPVLALGDIDLVHSYSFVPDVARGLVSLGDDDRGDGRVWHLPTNPATTTREVHETVAALLGTELAIEVITEPRPVGPFDEVFMDEYAELFYQHEIPQHMVSTAFETTFGLTPTPMDVALKRTLDWYEEALR